MRRYFALIAFLVVFAGNRVPGQQALSEEEKKRLFLKAREEMTTIPYTPPPKPGDTPKPKAPAPAPAVKPATPRPAPSVPAAPSVQPTPVSPAPPVRPANEPSAPIVVHRPGVVEADRDEPSAPEPDGFWSRVFGSTNYKYLTPAIRRAIDRAPVKRGRWRYIVIHNSGTRQGNAAAFEYYHRRVRGMPNGMAYQFVVGNGSSTKNGQIEIGNRWHRQIQGGHVHSDYLNNIALGICLVGDFNHSEPTAAQLEATAELVDYLRRKVGRVGGQRAVVRPHKEVNPSRWPTDCPGDKFPYSWFRKF